VEGLKTSNVLLDCAGTQLPLISSCLGVERKGESESGIELATVDMRVSCDIQRTPAKGKRSKYNECREKQSRVSH